jgi:isocitrate/isopropylmalate dehydrogenase
MAKARKRVVALGGDGVGPEVVAATCHVLEGAEFDVDIEQPLCGEAAVAQGHEAFSEEVRQLCDGADAVLFGATGTTSGAILRYLRWTLDNYVNVRPLKYYAGARSCIRDPEGIDFVILRENSEGMYSFFGGDLSVLREKLPELRSNIGRTLADYGEGRFALRIISERGAQRLAEFACELALARKEQGFPGRIACPTKSNVIPSTDRFL